MKGEGREFPFLRYAWLGLALVVLIFLAFYLVVSNVEEETYRMVVESANEHFGILSMCIYIWATDTFVLPLSPMFVFPFLIEYPWYFIVPVTGLSSASGGVTAYLIGRLIGKVPVISKWAESAYRKWGDVIKRYGLTCVLLSSLLPLPYSTVSMAAGVMRLPLGKVALISLTRTLRMAIYYAMFSLGILVS